MEFLVLADYRASPPGLRFVAGEIIDDQQIAVQPLLNDGLAAVVATDANKATATRYRAYKASHSEIGSEHLLSLLTTDGLLGGGVGRTSGMLEFFVRDVGGSDTNAGTEASPFKTLQHVGDIIPAYVDDPVLTHVGDHSGAGYSLPVMGPRVQAPGAHIVFIGDGAGVGDGFTDTGNGVLTATGGTTDTLIMVTGSPLGGVDTEFENTIEFLTGPALGQRKLIGENTAGSITPLARFNPAPNPGDSFRIVTPSVLLDHDPTGNVSYSMTQPRDTLAVLMFAQFASRGTLAVTANSDGMDTLFYGIDANWGGRSPAGFQSALAGAVVRFGTDNAVGVALGQAVYADLGLAAAGAWDGWGIARRDSTSGQFPQGNPDVSSEAGGYYIESNWSNATLDGHLTLNGGRLRGFAGGPTIGMLTFGETGFIDIGTFDTSYVRMDAAGADDVISITLGRRVSAIEGNYNAASGTVFNLDGGGEMVLVAGPGFVTASESATGNTVECDNVNSRVDLFFDPDGFIGRGGAETDWAVSGAVGTPFAASAWALAGDKEIGDEFNIIKRVL